MATVAKPEERAAWLAWRSKGIGGSDAAAIAGLSPWKSPYVVWLEKTGQLLDDGHESEAMRWGTLLEPVIADEFEHRTGLYVTHRQLQAENPEEPWRRATLDGLVAEPSRHELDEALGIYEGKTTSTIRYGLDWSSGIPDHYALQVQHNLAVTGQDRAWVTCLIGGQELVIHEVERDPDVIAELLEIEREFWWRVEHMKPPAADGTSRTADAIREAFSEPTPGRTIELPDELRQHLYALADARALKKQAEAREKEAQNALMAALGDAEAALLDGREVITWKGVEDHRLDQKALRAEMPEVAEKYTRTATLRRFLLKDKEL